MKMPSGTLYKEYCKLVSKPVMARAYGNYMKKMVNLGLVIAKGKVNGELMKSYCREGNILKGLREKNYWGAT